MSSFARRSLLIVVLAVVGTLGGCQPYHGSLYAKRPADADLDLEISRWWAEEIRRVAKDGDWLLARSYVPVGDAIVTFTTGEEYSHAASIDVTHDTVIESTTPSVQEVPLETFVHRYRYVTVVRNHRLTELERRATLDLMRNEIGAEFDIWGMIGFDDPDKWYCSELVWWANGMDYLYGRPAMIVPNELQRYGEVVYFSGRRDDKQIQSIAAARRASHHGIDHPL
jgi:hypothetical protein